MTGWRSQPRTFAQDPSAAPRRRHAARWAGPLVALALTGCAGGPSRDDPNVGHPLVEPEVVRSVNGVLDLTLDVAYADHEIAGQPVRLRSYDGRLTGKTWRVEAGDRLRVRLRNRLPERPDSKHAQHDPNEPHGFNVTNLHTHGLHVSPQGNADNPFIAIKPGETFQFDIALPDDHPPGTFWYHPHRHGSVALQVASGMSGTLIVEGGLDDAPALRGVRERVMVMQQIPYQIDDQGVGTVEDYAMFAPASWQLSGRQTTINGQVWPLVELAPGEVQRWRVVHAGLRESIRLRLVRCGDDWQPTQPESALELHEIATDGITRYRMAGKSTVALQPGNRSDVLVRIDAPGNYCLMDAASVAGLSLHLIAETRRTLARVRVTGERQMMPLPDADLRAYAPFEPITAAQVSATREVEFDMPLGLQGLAFTVNGQPFDPDRVDHRLVLGRTEEWALTSKRGAHPFHIHVNPFQVVSGAEPVWRDTVIVRPDDTIRVRSRYRLFTGKSVLHCHILDHEDRGMMQIGEIVDPE